MMQSGSSGETAANLSTIKGEGSLDPACWLGNMNIQPHAAQQEVRRASEQLPYNISLSPAARVDATVGFSNNLHEEMSHGKSWRRKAKREDLWDVFLSYRVNTDQKLVQDLYWRLVGTDVVVNGKSRKMRPFWDAECLRSGESWEVGFCNAICRSTLIVAVMSRNALANVKHLEPHSACDNVILEYALASALVL
jgi:hypothetical protein